MGRPPRPNADGLTFHVLNRGNVRADVFHDDDDRHAYLAAMAKTQPAYPFQLYGYCLMSNHVHPPPAPARPRGRPRKVA